MCTLSIERCRSSRSFPRAEIAPFQVSARDQLQPCGYLFYQYFNFDWFDPIDPNIIGTAWDCTIGAVNRPGVVYLECDYVPKMDSSAWETAMTPNIEGLDKQTQVVLLREWSLEEMGARVYLVSINWIRYSAVLRGERRFRKSTQEIYLGNPTILKFYFRSENCIL